MTDREIQQLEIETIKPRNIALNLSDADCERISIKAAVHGISVEDLLKNFIGDLVWGTYSNGSDERSMANDWLDRCGFVYVAPQRFIKHIIELTGDDVYAIKEIKRAVGDYDDLLAKKALLDELEKMEKDEDFDWEYYNDVQEDVNDYHDDVLAWFTDYQIQCELESFDVEKEIEICRKWLSDLEKLKG